MGKLIVESRASSCQLGVHTPSLSPLFTRTSAKRINYRARLLMRYPRIVERTWKGGKRNISWEEESQLLCERCKKEKEKVKISSSKRVFFFFEKRRYSFLKFYFNNRNRRNFLLLFFMHNNSNSSWIILIRATNEVKYL